MPRPLDWRLRVVDLGTTPLGSLGSTPTPPPGSTLGGCTGTTPTPPPGSTPWGPFGSTLRWSGGSTDRPEGVGRSLRHDARVDVGLHVRRGRLRVRAFVVVRLRISPVSRLHGFVPWFGLITHLICRSLQTRCVTEGRCRCGTSPQSLAPSTRRGEEFRCFSHTRTRF